MKVKMKMKMKMRVMSGGHYLDTAASALSKNGGEMPFAAKRGRMCRVPLATADQAAGEGTVKE
jgi:hypothetical protein